MTLQEIQAAISRETVGKFYLEEEFNLLAKQLQTCDDVIEKQAIRKRINSIFASIAKHPETQSLLHPVMLGYLQKWESKHTG